MVAPRVGGLQRFFFFATANVNASDVNVRSHAHPGRRARGRRGVPFAIYSRPTAALLRGRGERGSGARLTQKGAMRPLLPPLTALRVLLRETGAGGLALDGPASVPTQAKRDADGLAVDARTFLADARALVGRVDNEPVFEPELAEEAQLLVERGAYDEKDEESTASTEVDPSSTLGQFLQLKIFIEKMKKAEHVKDAVLENFGEYEALLDEKIVEKFEKEGKTEETVTLLTSLKLDHNTELSTLTPLLADLSSQEVDDWRMKDGDMEGLFSEFVEDLGTW